MKHTLAAVLILGLVTSIGFAQDWYHERDERYRGEEWHHHVFAYVRHDLEHIWSARNASEKEDRRLERTKEELTKMQADLDQGRWDNGLLNDVIDSLRKSANDDRLSPRDRDVLNDDVNRLHDYQRNHKHWAH